MRVTRITHRVMTLSGSWGLCRQHNPRDSLATQGTHACLGQSPVQQSSKARLGGADAAVVEKGGISTWNWRWDPWWEASMPGNAWTPFLWHQHKCQLFGLRTWAGTARAQTVKFVNTSLKKSKHTHGHCNKA